MQYPNAAFAKYQGVGMTSQRTRNRMVNALIEQGIEHPQVIEALRQVPRHLFLDEALASRSYENTALPIGYGQTISQPWVVAKMTQWLLEAGSVSRVLEIGTGSGYQTAILALLVDHVYTVERIMPLSEKARQTLSSLQLDNIEYAISDGHWGWAERAPFDAIISAASPDELPPELLEQLKVGGRLILPIGNERQGLYGYEKTLSGVRKTKLADVLFVPMKQGVEV
ncbi:protein-L-isoaspartate(D-aspartate) O-methyltransferase [Thiomicrorhabdus sp.]|uniref:protein-L-isoaspartate(D-aspartate) O-methyltransferase n=1 Tax=Thiomicrorhabdus sp. TaxID=2039724 RepID=UPI0029C82732|nr:protein-L-isoaspartate(D-aspartate) O-methyltransferase [Thiomicrorhabdus sp.]